MKILPATRARITSTALVCHDAGGAEIISSWAKQSENTCYLVAEGPAIDIFKRKCPELLRFSLNDAVRKCDWVLCGTGWQSQLEREGVSAGKALNKKTIAFLDHWVNYEQRFRENDDLILPDEIWVGDNIALEIARSLFQKTPITLQKNPYVEELLEEIDKKDKLYSSSDDVTVLYVCEPIADHAFKNFGSDRHWGYTEKEAVDFFMTYKKLISHKISKVIFRPHPSEPKDKYDWIRKRYPQQVEIGGKLPLLDEVLKSDIIVGCESMAMIVGLLADRKVISTIPAGGRPCQLPHLDIIKLTDLVNGNIANA
ncbi:hypothetical protein [Lentilitoribacter sp. EG35]|uniref:hypothetical protein n=1 Tax=Lentilitoribacter sp. EG35 TaxID=3234192 RepID=UPI00346099E4